MSDGSDKQECLTPSKGNVRQSYLYFIHKFSSSRPIARSYIVLIMCICIYIHVMSLRGCTCIYMYIIYICTFVLAEYSEDFPLVSTRTDTKKVV